MRKIQSLSLLALFSLLFVAGCSGGKNGAMTVTATSEQFVPGIYLVKVTAAYTNPDRTNLLGLKIRFEATGMAPFEEETNSSGSITVTLPYAQTTSSQALVIVAKVDDVQGYATTSIPGIAPPKITVVPPVAASATGKNSTKTIPLTLPPTFAKFEDNGVGQLNEILTVTAKLFDADVTFEQVGLCTGTAFISSTECTFDLPPTDASGFAGIPAGPVNVIFSNVSTVAGNQTKTGTVYWGVVNAAATTFGNGQTVITYTETP